MTLILLGASIGTAIGFVFGTLFGAVLWRVSQGDALHVWEPSGSGGCVIDDDDDEDADHDADAWKRGRGGYKGRG